MMFQQKRMTNLLNYVKYTLYKQMKTQKILWNVALTQLISNKNNPSILAYYGLYRGVCLFAY